MSSNAMTVCVVCGEEDFDVRDGLYFCTTCHTQSQLLVLNKYIDEVYHVLLDRSLQVDEKDIRQEEEEEYVGTIAHTLAIKQPKERNKEKTDMPNQSKVFKSQFVSYCTVKCITSICYVFYLYTVEDKGRPWHTYEGFLIIIREQVQALIKLGAPKTLEDKVFRLWCTYLSKSGIAFPENSKKIPGVLKNAMRHREKYPGTIEDPSIEPVVIRRRYRNRQGLSEEKFEAELAKKEVAEKLLSEEFYKGDNPVDDDNCVLEDDVKSLISDLTSHCSDDEDDENKTVKKRNKTKEVEKDRNYHKHIEWMNMLKTLCFCYIGLLYSDCLVTASDIIRWVKKGKIPYYNAMHLLPPDMKFSEVHGYVMNLLHVKPAVINYIVEFTSRIPHYEALAMTYIITILQLLLGLDDFTERKLSEYAKEINRLLNDGNF
ncbi:hypothetical protein KUTeg_005542 [Tegillarca granosa]|uniref:Rrn7/TAF1B N-terminal cyclin domain-containing protein n=1 Tax=Tegillarca granosa TaxID=220873 RepID=A0ABQ9FPK8_TEGGR|nr:hypothetical protein KUTeg_005542 [Tegillarca granosa]